MRLILSAMLAATAAPPAVVAPALRAAPLGAATAPLLAAPLSAPAAALSAPAAAAAAPATEAFLREDLSYVPSARRAVLGDASVVEAEAPGMAPDRVSFDHPGLVRLQERIAELKARAAAPDELFAGLRALVREEAARPGAAAASRALTRRATRRTRAVQLGEALQSGALDARRAALAAHLALKFAGFAPKLARLRAADGAERLVNLIHADGGQTVFAPLAPALDGRRLSDLLESGAAEELDGPRAFTPAGKPKTSGVEARAPGLPAFAVTGRSAAERQFKEDAARLSAAAPDEPVAVEWLYMPFYADGHAALRVGDQVYEWRRSGWRVQSARAFLFNNPFFDAQYLRHAAEGMPPFSLGLTLSLPKRAADALVARVARERESGWPRFSYFLNNCTQRPLKFLRDAGVAGLPSGRFTSFSTIRAFRLLLLNPPPGAGAARLYPLPGRVGSAEPYGLSIPREIREPRSLWRDALGFATLWPKFLNDKLARLKRLPKTDPPSGG